MLDIKFIREHPEEVREGCRKKGVGFDLDRLLEVDERRRRALMEVEGLRSQQKRVSKEIYQKKGEAARTEEIDTMRNLKAQLRESEKELSPIEDEYYALMRMIPLTATLFRFENIDWFRLEVVLDESGSPVKLIGHYENGFRDESPRSSDG